MSDVLEIGVMTQVEPHVGRAVVVVVVAVVVVVVCEVEVVAVVVVTKKTSEFHLPLNIGNISSK